MTRCPEDGNGSPLGGLRAWVGHNPLSAVGTGRLNESDEVVQRPRGIQPRLARHYGSHPPVEAGEGLSGVFHRVNHVPHYKLYPGPPQPALSRTEGQKAADREGVPSRGCAQWPASLRVQRRERGVGVVQ